MEFYKKLIISKYILKNWLSYYTSFFTPIPIGYVIIGVTYACNSHCIMCNMWKVYGEEKGGLKNEMEILPLIEKLKESKLLKKISHIDITGGEPFLKKDLRIFLKEIINLQSIQILSLTTNCLLTEKIIEDVKEVLYSMPKNKIFSICISLDGINSVYNEIRGVSDGFKKVKKTIDELLKLKINFPQLDLRTNIVIQPKNVNNLEDIKIFCLSKGLNPSFSLIQTPFVTHTRNSEYNIRNFSEKEIKKIREITNENRWINFFLESFKKRVINCFAGYTALYIDPYGNIYPCNFLGENKNYIMGNIEDKTIDEIWRSKEAWIIRREIKKCPYNDCWNGCEVHQTLVQYSLIDKVIKVLSFGRTNYYKMRGLQ